MTKRAVDFSRLKRERGRCVSHRPFYHWEFCDAGVCLSFFILLCVSVSNTVPRDSLAQIAVPVLETARPPVLPPIDTLKPFQNTDFYRTIIDNNLFRPLGWRPPRPQEPYRLLGTIIPIDAKSPPKAIIQDTVGNQTHIVTIGDTLDSNTDITDIQTKHVPLKKNGQQRQLTLKSSFLQRR